MKHTQQSKEEKAKKVVVILIASVSILFIGAISFIILNYTHTPQHTSSHVSNITLIHHNDMDEPHSATTTYTSSPLLDRLNQLKKDGPTPSTQSTPRSILGHTPLSSKDTTSSEELDLNAYISTNPFDSQRQLDSHDGIDFGQRIKGVLLKSIDTQDNDKTVLAELAQTPFGRVTLTGTYSISPKNKKIYIQFSTLYGKNNLTIPINAVAYAMNGESGLDAELYSNSTNKILKSVLEGVKDIAISAVGGASPQGAAVVYTAANDPISEIDTQVSMKVSEHTPFLVVFNNRITL